MYPERKQNRLADFDYSQPGAYFITVCTQNRKYLLSTIVGADDHIGPRVRLTKTGEIVQKYLCQIPGIGAYVIMPNHVHMILHISATDILNGPMWSSAPTNAKIPSLVRTWKTLVSKELGESIWQRSYYDHIIRDEHDYSVKMQYIAENPEKWYFDDYYCG